MAKRDLFLPKNVMNTVECKIMNITPVKACLPYVKTELTETCYQQIKTRLENFGETSRFFESIGSKPDAFIQFVAALKHLKCVDIYDIIIKELRSYCKKKKIPEQQKIYEDAIEKEVKKMMSHHEDEDEEEGSQGEQGAVGTGPANIPPLGPVNYHTQSQEQAPPPAQTPPYGQTLPPPQAPPPAQTPPYGQTLPPPQASPHGQTPPPPQASPHGQTPPPPQASPYGQTPPPPHGNTPPSPQASPYGQTLPPPHGQTPPPPQASPHGQTPPHGQTLPPPQAPPHGQTPPPAKAPPFRQDASAQSPGSGAAATRFTLAGPLRDPTTGQPFPLETYTFAGPQPTPTVTDRRSDDGIGSLPSLAIKALQSALLKKECIGDDGKTRPWWRAILKSKNLVISWDTSDKIKNSKDKEGKALLSVLREIGYTVGNLEELFRSLNFQSGLNILQEHRAPMAPNQGQMSPEYIPAAPTTGGSMNNEQTLRSQGQGQHVPVRPNTVGSRHNEQTPRSSGQGQHVPVRPNTAGSRHNEQTPRSQGQGQHVPVRPNTAGSRHNEQTPSSHGQGQHGRVEPNIGDSMYNDQTPRGQGQGQYGPAGPNTAGQGQGQQRNPVSRQPATMQLGQGGHHQEHFPSEPYRDDSMDSEMTVYSRSQDGPRQTPGQYRSTAGQQQAMMNMSLGHGHSLPSQPSGLSSHITAGPGTLPSYESSQNESSVTGTGYQPVDDPLGELAGKNPEMEANRLREDCERNVPRPPRNPPVSSVHPENASDSTSGTSRWSSNEPTSLARPANMPASTGPAANHSVPRKFPEQKHVDGPKIDLANAARNYKDVQNTQKKCGSISPPPSYSEIDQNRETNQNRETDEDREIDSNRETTGESVSDNVEEEEIQISQDQDFSEDDS